MNGPPLGPGPWARVGRMASRARRKERAIMPMRRVRIGTPFCQQLPLSLW